MTSVWRLQSLSLFIEFYHHLKVFYSFLHSISQLSYGIPFCFIILRRRPRGVHSTHWFHCSVFNEQFQDRQRRRKEIEVNTSFIRLLSSHYQSHFSFVQCNLPTRDVKVAWIWIHCCVRDSSREIFTLILFLEFL